MLLNAWDTAGDLLPSIQSGGADANDVAVVVHIQRGCVPAWVGLLGTPLVALCVTGGVGGGIDGNSGDTRCGIAVQDCHSRTIRPAGEEDSLLVYIDQRFALSHKGVDSGGIHIEWNVGVGAVSVKIAVPIVPAICWVVRDGIIVCCKSHIGQ